VGQPVGVQISPSAPKYEPRAICFVAFLFSEGHLEKCLKNILIKTEEIVLSADTFILPGIHSTQTGVDPLDLKLNSFPVLLYFGPLENRVNFFTKNNRDLF
jgi:hypothetical protein